MEASIASSGSAATPTVAGMANVYESQVTIDTYNFGNYLYSQYNTTYNMYYKRLNWDVYRKHRAKAPRTYDTLVMENDYLELTIIPGIGGRIYSCVFKPTVNN